MEISLAHTSRLFPFQHHSHGFCSSFPRVWPCIREACSWQQPCIPSVGEEHGAGQGIWPGVASEMHVEGARSQSGTLATRVPRTRLQAKVLPWWCTSRDRQHFLQSTTQSCTAGGAPLCDTLQATKALSSATKCWASRSTTSARHSRGRTTSLTSAVAFSGLHWKGWGRRQHVWRRDMERGRATWSNRTV